MAPTRSFTRQQVAESICAGSSLFVYDSLVISVPQQWSKSHPGGALAIAHFIGRDATDEVDAYHSPQAIAKLRKFAVGTIDLEGRTTWKPLTPPIALGLVQHPDGVKGHWKREGRIRLAEEGVERDVRAKLLDSGVVIKDGKSYIDILPSTSSGTSTPSDPSLIVLHPHQLEPLSQSVSDVDPEIELQRSNAYRELRQRITDAGLFIAPKWFAGYTSDLLRYTILGGIAFGLHLRTTSWSGQMASAVFLGLFYHQLTFLAHDAGHTGITGNYLYDRIIGTIVADWIGGLSLGWWCDNHNIHHLVTNHPEHDPDIQHIPFFAITKDFFSGLWSTYYKRVMALDVFARTFIGIQHKLYYIVLSLARFNLYANSYSYLLLKSPRHRLFYFELTGIAFFWTYFLSMLASLPTWKMRIAYLLVSHIVTSPVHVQIVLSHFACSTEDLGPGESFPSRQLRTTMDVVCGENIEFVHGGLHLQVTHHLFPRLPRHNLRKASKLVKEYCAEQGILYREHGWLEGNQYVLSTLRDVANQLSILKQVAEKEAREGHVH